MNNQAIRKDWVGQLVNARFRLLRWLGSAGRSQVFACDIEGNPERKAAIKLFPADADGAQSCAAGWATALTLFHPHLMRVLYTGQDRIDGGHVLYVVTEYASEVLSEILPDRPLTPEETKEMLGPVLDALAYLHGKGLVHGRVKPSNIMVVDDQVKLSEENIRGSAGAAAAPPALDIYDSPERAGGKVLPASDLWSLGITLVETLTQMPPVWNRSSGLEPAVPPSVPKPFDQIARACLRADPSLRCTLSEVKACLQSGAAIPRRNPSPQPEAKPAPDRRKDGRKAVLAASGAVLLAIVAIVVFHPRHGAPPSQPGQQANTSAPAGTQPPAVARSRAPRAKKLPKATGQPANSQTLPQASANQTASSPGAAPSTPQRAQGSTNKGAVAQQVTPAVPAKASATIHGTISVGIEVHVDANGAVSDASIDSQGPSKYFANLALKAARAWRFTPPQVNGQPVASVWLLHFLFRQSGVEVTPAEQTP